MGALKNGKEFKAKVLVEYTVASKFYFETAWCILLGVRIIDRQGDDIVEFPIKSKKWLFGGLKGPLLRKAVGQILLFQKNRY